MNKMKQWILIAGVIIAGVLAYVFLVQADKDTQKTQESQETNETQEESNEDEIATPDQRADAFFVALSDKDYNAIYNLVDKDFRQTIDDSEDYHQVVDGFLEKYPELLEYKKLDLEDYDLKDDDTSVELNGNFISENTENTITIEMIKENQEWMVSNFDLKSEITLSEDEENIVDTVDWFVFNIAYKSYDDIFTALSENAKTQYETQDVFIDSIDKIHSKYPNAQYLFGFESDTFDFSSDGKSVMVTGYAYTLGGSKIDFMADLVFENDNWFIESYDADFTSIPDEVIDNNNNNNNDNDNKRESVYDYTNEFYSFDLGFRVFYPDSWVYVETKDIYMVEFSGAKDSPDYYTTVYIQNVEGESPDDVLSGYINDTLTNREVENEDGSTSTYNYSDVEYNLTEYEHVDYANETLKGISSYITYTLKIDDKNPVTYVEWLVIFPRSDQENFFHTFLYTADEYDFDTNRPIAEKMLEMLEITE